MKNVYPIHHIAKRNPEQSDREYNTMVYGASGIAVIGQQEPALLWNGQIVNGRHRMRACQELGIDLIVEELPEGTTYIEASSRALATDNRRELTPTQHAVKAYLYFCKTGEMTYKETAAALPVSKAMLSVCKQIDDIDDTLLPVLFNGDAIKLPDPKVGRFVSTTKLNLILRLLKTKQHMADKVKCPYDYGFDIEAHGLSDRAVKFYFNRYLLDPNKEGLIELLRHKFPS